MSKDIKQRFWKELADNPYLMVALDAGHAHAIPMTAQLDKDNDGYFHFFHAKSGRLAAGGRNYVIEITWLAGLRSTAR